MTTIKALYTSDNDNNTYIHFIQQTTKHVFGYVQQIKKRQTE